MTVRHYAAVAGARPREIAARALGRTGVPGDFLEHQLEADAAFQALSDPDRRLVQEMVFGVLRHRASLDWLIDRRLKGRPPRPVVRDLLRLGLYQVFHLDRVPPHAAVHETVAAARRLAAPGEAGLVNALLRGYLRELEPARRDLAVLRESHPALAGSHPDWLVERWRQRWPDPVAPGGVPGWQALIDWDNSPPPTFARVNHLRTDTPGLLARWQAEGVEFEQFTADWIPAGLVFRLRRHPPLGALPSFRSGGFYLQDPSTLLAVTWLGAGRGDRILDLCAAPGGKATCLAQFLGNEGTVVAHDTHPGRLARVAENARRLGASAVVVTPPADLPPAASGFDRVLVDAPCSNTGVLRRRLEARWRLQPGEIPRLAAEQGRLLDQGAAHVKPGGTLVYSTCSLEPEENTAVASAFAGRHPEFVEEGSRELWPFREGVDGAFVARFRRRA